MNHGQLKILMIQMDKSEKFKTYFKPILFSYGDLKEITNGGDCSPYDYPDGAGSGCV